MNNRQRLATAIADKFEAMIGGTDREQFVDVNPENRILVGKLSPRCEANAFSSRVQIKQIRVDFSIPKYSIDDAEIIVFPRGHFYYRVIPTLEQQRAYYLKSFRDSFRQQGVTFGSFEEIAELFTSNRATEAMRAHKVSLVSVYERIAIERDNTAFSINLGEIYHRDIERGFLGEDHKIYRQLEAANLKLCEEAKQKSIPCTFRDKVTIENIMTPEAWDAYVKKQANRSGEIEIMPRFEYSLSVNLIGKGENISVWVALSNETQFGDETRGFGTEHNNDAYRINTLFNAGMRIECKNTVLVPILLDYFKNDYKYDKEIYALGNSCNVTWDLRTMSIETTHIPRYLQNRLVTISERAVSFQSLIDDPVSTLEKTYRQMIGELEKWRADYRDREARLTVSGKEQFQYEINQFEFEIKRFYTGVCLIKKYNMIKQSFQYMNRAFQASAKGYDSWRLFQIVFIVSLILDVVVHEPDLMLEPDITEKAKTDDVDILYFPTGGGKTEAFLGILVFNLFFDRIRGKEAGVTAILKYPLRLLSVQQVQRVSNILAMAELIRKAEALGGRPFSLGYYVGDNNTPNRIDRESMLRLSSGELNDKHRLLDVCPFCNQPSVHIVYDEERHTLFHECRNTNCSSGGRLPLYMVDEDIYRYIPSVMISTVDKMTAVGCNSRFHNLIFGASYECPVHGFTSGRKCSVKSCTCTPLDFRRVHMKDPAPTLMIQDELHLIKESLGVYDAHYETLIGYFIKNLSGCNRGIKVIGATATISAYEEQAKHLYWKNAIRFPSESPYLDRNFYSKLDPEDVGRIIIGFAPFGMAMENSVAYALKFLKKIVWEFYQNPESILAISGMQFEGTQEERLSKAKALIDEYWIILEYNTVKLESNNIIRALEEPINVELKEEGVEPFQPKTMTGDDTFQDVRTILSEIEHAETVIGGLDFNMIAATSMISHGVDADRFNLMMFYGIPGNTAEYIQAYSRVGRKYTGLVIDVLRPMREKDQSFLSNFMKFHEFKDILVDSVSINRWASKAVESTLPGVISALILNYYLYNVREKDPTNDISKFRKLKEWFLKNTEIAQELKKHAYAIYKCSDGDSSAGRLYRRTIDNLIDSLVTDIRNCSMDATSYIISVFDKVNFHIMNSLRDTDNSLIIETE